MLVTTPDAEVTHLPYFWPPSARAWRTVTLELAIPYFLIQHAEREGLGWLSQTSILWRVEDVIELCRGVAADKNRRVNQMSLLLPVGVERKMKWELKQIVELHSQSDTEGRMSVQYIDQEGKSFLLHGPRGGTLSDPILEYSSVAGVRR